MDYPISQPSFPVARCPKRMAQSGSALSIIVVMIIALLGFLGITIYTGLNAYIQNELQNAVTAAAGAGAIAFYDNFDASGNPVKDIAAPATAAQTTFNNILSVNPALQSFGARLINPPAVNVGNETVTLQADATVPTPFLAGVGIDEYTVEANATARFAKRQFPPNAISIATTAPPFYNTLTMDPPITDGPGPDLYLETGKNSAGGYHGVMVEVCSGGKCYDVGRAAKGATATESLVVDRNYPTGGMRRVLYGKFNIDLGASNSTLGYNANVKKGSSLRIIDDGVHDFIVPGGTIRRGVELSPENTTINMLRSMHGAVYCPEPANCPLPAGYVSGTTP